MSGHSHFDDYGDYDAALGRGLAVSGEGRDYFANGRITFLARCLREMGHTADSALDFGCGDGASVPLLSTLIGARTVAGVDDSRRSLAAATTAHGGPGVTFSLTSEHAPAANFDLVYANGVFHHIPIAQ